MPVPYGDGTTAGPRFRGHGCGPSPCRSGGRRILRPRPVIPGRRRRWYVRGHRAPDVGGHVRGRDRVQREDRGRAQRDRRQTAAVTAGPRPEQPWPWSRHRRRRHRAAPAHEGILRRQSLRESAARTYARSLPDRPGARPRADHRGRRRPPLPRLPLRRRHPGPRPQPPRRPRGDPEGPRLGRARCTSSTSPPRSRTPSPPSCSPRCRRELADDARIQFCGPGRHGRRRGRAQAGPHRHRPRPACSPSPAPTTA